MEIKRSGSQPSGKGPAEYFTGAVRVDPMFQAPDPGRVAGASVTFEPGARTAWHTHPLGQTLIVTAGCGWVQREGGPIEEIRRLDLAYNLGNFPRTLAMPEPIKEWSLTSPKDQDRRQGHQPRPLCCLPNGRGRHLAVSVCRHPAANRGTAAFVDSRIDVKRLIVLRPIKNQRRGASG
jgi:hypothetical protein